jgi:adenosylcobyric acid synthase
MVLKQTKAKLLMVQGTGSSVGKSVLVAGLCRYFARLGVAVVPFKAQNMALNSYITSEGHEMGRAQVVQAEACGLTPHVHMNPVLIKPNSDVGAQVIIHGVPVGNMSAVKYHQYKETAWEAVLSSFSFLQENYELIIIEGAGSPAEINLRENDIVNMGLATHIGAPVLLVGDIDKGGVFASLVGTMELLSPDERELVKGFVINRFRGDRRLLEPGLETISRRCDVPFVGVVPYFRDLYLPEEDGVAVEGYGKGAEEDVAASPVEKLLVAVIKLPHISNFTDFDALVQEVDVRLDYLQPEEDFAGYDLVIIPGSKNTIDDLRGLLKAGFAHRLTEFAAAGGAVAGICGGYQMLGLYITDPFQVETTQGRVEGFGLLAVQTELDREKVTVQSRGELVAGAWPTMVQLQVSGYEIHMGRTRLESSARALLLVAENSTQAVHYDGALSADGTVWGTYFHGIFDNDDFRRQYLNRLKQKCFGAQVASLPAGSFAAQKEKGLDSLADLLADVLDMTAIKTIIENC